MQQRRKGYVPPGVSLATQKQKTCKWLKQRIKLQVVYLWILFPCASVWASTNLLWPCPPHPDKCGTWPFLNSEADLLTEYNLNIREGRCVSNKVKSLSVCVSKSMWNSIVHVSVYTCLCLYRGMRDHMCLFVHIWLLLGVCVSVCMYACEWVQ